VASFKPNDLDKEYYSLVKGSVYKSKAKFGFSDFDTEDMIQEIYTRMLEGRFHKKKKIDYCIIDILRDRSGRKGGQYYKARLHLFNAYDVDDEKLNIKQMYFQSECLKDFDAAIIGLDRINRCILLLIHIWGFTNSDCSRLFGMSEVGIMYRRRAIMEKLRKVKYFKESKAPDYD